MNFQFSIFPACRSGRNFQNNRGFTLVELLVSMTIFTVVTLIAVGALLNLSHVNDRSQAFLAALENLDFAIEHMSRVIRTGKDYDCDGSFPDPIPTDCSIVGSSIISFVDQNGVSVRFQLLGEAIVRERYLFGNPPEPMLQITAPEIIIEDLTFFVVGTDTFLEGDSLQPRVLMTVRGKTNIAGFSPDEQADFNLQTTVSQRDPDD